MAEDKNDSSEFVLKLQDMLENYKHIVDWNQDQTEIIVKDLKKVTEEVLPKYFRHRKFQSFVRQLNMYNFYKVCRQKNNTISFKNDVFFRGNEGNFSKIKRKKKNDFKTRPSDILEQNLSFVTNHPSIDHKTKSILTDLMNFKNVTNYSSRKMDSLFNKLGPEMKATKFKKYNPMMSALRTSSSELDTKSEEIEQFFQKSKCVKISQVPIPDNEKAVPVDFGYYQRNLDIALSQTNICSTLIEHCEEKRYQTEVSNNNIYFQIQTFLSITKFLRPDEAKIPTVTKLEVEEGARAEIREQYSRTSIENQIPTN